MWRDTLRGWRAFALVFFIIIAVLEYFEVTGDLFGFFDLPAFAQLSGITPALQAQHLLSLTILSTAIAISATVTAYSILRQKSWSVRAGTITGIVLLLYMVYQVSSALVFLTQNRSGVVGAGSTYGIFGLFGMWLVRKAGHNTNARNHS